MEPNDPKLKKTKSDQTYSGLSKREVEMRKRMAERFGRKTEHLAPAKREELTVDAEKIY